MDLVFLVCKLAVTGACLAQGRRVDETMAVFPVKANALEIMMPVSFLLSANAPVYRAVQGRWLEGKVWTNCIDIPARLPPRTFCGLVDKYLVF